MADEVQAAAAAMGAVVVPVQDPAAIPAASAAPVAVPVPPPPLLDVKTVAVNGVDVMVNLSYVRSWEGVIQIKRMQDSSQSEQDRFWAMVEYYDHVCPNAADVAKALGGEAVEVSVVFSTISSAVKAVSPKN